MKTVLTMVGAVQTSPCFVPAPPPIQLGRPLLAFFCSLGISGYLYRDHEMAQALAGTKKS